MNEQLLGKEAIVPEELVKPPTKEEETPVSKKTRSDKMGLLREFCSKLGEGEKVKCKLCGKTYDTKSFAHHMRTMHLPDETCPGCGEEFRPNQLFRHQQQCAGLPEPLGFKKQLSTNFIFFHFCLFFYTLYTVGALYKINIVTSNK